MRKKPGFFTLDPIDRKNLRNPGTIGRFMMTRRFRGKSIKPLFPYGHYLFCGRQGGGKTASCLFYYEYLQKKYGKHFTVELYSNLGIGKPISKYSISETIRSISYSPNTIHILIIDELQSYFPRDTKDSKTLAEIDKLVSDFSQLRKRSIFVLSTAQIYGRVNKSLREQCLYMINCRKSRISNKLVNDFIDGDDIICDEQGRWSGTPCRIFVHGLPRTSYDTHRLIIH